MRETSSVWRPEPYGDPGQSYMDEAALALGAQNLPLSAPKRIKTWRLLLIGLAVLIFAGKCFYLGSKALSYEHLRATPVAGIGQEVRDGQFMFIVEGVRVTKNLYGEQRPGGGEFVVATVRVANSGNVQKPFGISSQKLIDSYGRTYAADTNVARQINHGETSTTIYPGRGSDITMKIPFFLGAGHEPAKLELHDASLSGGVWVEL